MQPDVKRIGEALGLGGRINQENWIEQAQVLAKGGETYFATRRARGEAASAAPTPDEGERRVRLRLAAPRPCQPTAAPRRNSARRCFRTRRLRRPAGLGAARLRAELQPASATAPGRRCRPTVPAAAVPMCRPAAHRRHTTICSASAASTPQVESAARPRKASRRYSQIAHWSPADVERFDSQLGTAGRIGRENWIEQAQILSRGGDTAFSRDYDRRVAEPCSAPRPVKLADAIRRALPRPGRGIHGARDVGSPALVRRGLPRPSRRRVQRASPEQGAAIAARPTISSASAASAC